MLTQITFYPMLGLPLIAWGGLITFILLILTALIGYLNSKGVVKPPLITYKSHKIMAIITLISALGHGLLGLLAYI